MTTSPYPATLTVEQTAQLLGISRSSAYRGVNRGEIPSFRIGGRIIVPTGNATGSNGPRLNRWLGPRRSCTRRRPTPTYRES